MKINDIDVEVETSGDKRIDYRCSVFVKSDDFKARALWSANILNYCNDRFSTSSGFFWYLDTMHNASVVDFVSDQWAALTVKAYIDDIIHNITIYCVDVEYALCMACMILDEVHPDDDI